MKYHFVFYLFLVFIIPLFGQNNGMYLIYENGKYGYIDKQGKIVIETIFNNAYDFAEGLASVRQNGKFGFIDENGNYIIKPKYEYANSFLHGIACVYLNGKPMLINQKDQIVIKGDYKSIQLIDKDLAVVSTDNNLKGVIKISTKKLIIKPQFQSIQYYKNEAVFIAYTKERKKVGMLDVKGNLVVEFGKYRDIRNLNEGLAIVSIDNPQTPKDPDYGVIDMKGNLLFKHSTADNVFMHNEFSEGLAVVGLYKNWLPEKKGVLYTSEKSYDGFMDLNGNIVFNDTLCIGLKNFHEGRSFKKDKQGFQLIDKNFKVIGNNTYDQIMEVQNSTFKNGKAIVQNKYKWGIIDLEGNYLVEPKFKAIHKIGIIDDKFFYGNDSTDYRVFYGLANLDGEILTKPIFESIDFDGFKYGLLKGYASNKLLYLNEAGNIVWEQKDNKNIIPLNVDYMVGGYFYAGSEFDEEAVGGYYSSKNNSKPIRNIPFTSSEELVLFLDTQSKDTIFDNYSAHKVYLINNSNKKIKFNAQDSRLNMKVQAKDENGVWRDIEILVSSWCGNSYHDVSLDKKSYWEFKTPQYEGELKTKLRIEFTFQTDKKEVYRIYSNEYNGGVNPAQFWRLNNFVSNDIMNPYQ